ncbi:unnamed protein product, partial [Linum tenue]
NDKGDNVDYTSFFINDVVYDTHDDACAAAREIAMRNRFFLIVGSVKQNHSSEKYPRYYMDCNHGYRNKSYTPDLAKTTRCKSKTGKSDCRFRVVVRCSLVDGKCEWRIFGVKDKDNPGKSRGFHNHKLEVYSEGSRQRNYLSKERRMDIKEMEATHTQARDIRSFVNRKYDAHHHMKQIYNETEKIRRERLGGMKPMRWTLIEAQRLDYFVECEFDDERRVSRLFLCHPESIRMLSAWYFVILIDSTYTTNKYKQPLVQLIGVSPVKKNFNIGFALVSDETKLKAYKSLGSQRLKGDDHLRGPTPEILLRLSMRGQGQKRGAKQIRARGHLGAKQIRARGHLGAKPQQVSIILIFL